MKFWAYIHSQDRAIHLKRWFPPHPGELCDLEYAKLEREQGNDNILAIVPSPFSAENKDEAYKIAVKIFEEMGYSRGQVRYTDSSAWPRSLSLINKLQKILALKRFSNLD